MTSKNFFIILIFLCFVPCCLFAADSVFSRVNPEYSLLGEVYSENSNEVFTTFSSYLKQEFSFGWCENYFHSDVKKMLSKITSELSEMLPVKNVVFLKFNDEKYNKSFMFVAENNNKTIFIGSVVLDENLKILALDIKRRD